MSGYERVRDSLKSVSDLFGHLDAAQLFKHAFALRTEVHRENRHGGLTPNLFYSLCGARTLAGERKASG